MTTAVLQYIVYPVIAALLLWIGWLIKLQIENVQSSKKLNNEIYVALQTFCKCQDVMLDSMKVISEGLIIALTSDELQFQKFHDTGIMNGESVRHMERISEKLDNLNRVIDNIDELKGHLNDISSVCVNKTNKAS